MLVVVICTSAMQMIVVICTAVHVIMSSTFVFCCLWGIPRGLVCAFLC
mgnify:CR=1 FL=1